MNTLTARRHVLIGVVLLLATTLVLGWFAGRYIPGEPQSPQPDSEREKYPAGNATFIAVGRAVDTPFGETANIEDLTQGWEYTPTKPSVLQNWDPSLDESPILEVDYPPDPRSGMDHIAFPPFEISVEGVKTLSSAAFSEWYPDFGQDATLAKLESTVVLVDVTVTKQASSQVLDLSHVQLWSDRLTQTVPDCIGNGYAVSWSALESLNGIPRPMAGDYYDVSQLLAIESGATRTLTLPFQVFRNAFVDGAAFDELDISQFCLEFYDYDPPTVYRLWLG